MDLNSETRAPMGIGICEGTGTNLPQVLKGSSANSWITNGPFCPVGPCSPFNFSFDKLFGIAFSTGRVVNQWNCLERW